MADELELIAAHRAAACSALQAQYASLVRTSVAQANQLQEQARIITELRQLRDAVGKLKDANVTGAVERAYAAASESRRASKARMP